ncbi:MAG: FAD-binding protein [Bacteroidales bacterium]|nr:FAD-binding protein [Bacteroidales bacterium]
MRIKVANVRTPVNVRIDLMAKVCQMLRLDPSDISDFKILRQAVDARKKPNVFFDYQVSLEVPDTREELLREDNVSAMPEATPLRYPEWPHPDRPVVVGFGPAGMFAALYLARSHARPIILERGQKIEERKASVAKFMADKTLDPESNVQFGEGGAGTFSDGKLNTNVHSEYNAFVLREFYLHGADEDVTYLQNPHVGTDYLEQVVRNIRLEIESLGGEFHFNTCFTCFRQEDNGILHIFGKPDIDFQTQHLFLGIGHSARDTIRSLHKQGLEMEAKGFSMGVRIEHPQSLIDKMQYGPAARYLPPASYKGVVHLPERSVYTFCMCPGGTVMASTNDPETIVTNGMSERSRDKANANSALLVTVRPEDFFHHSPLDGLSYQEHYERKAFQIGNDYRAPGNLMKEFLQKTIAKNIRSIKPSYPHGIVFCDLKRCLPDYIVDSLRDALPLFDKKMHGFAHPDAVLTGIESRSSSPVRILRGTDRMCQTKGIYPIGEGAGYAGGIMSAAIDGLKSAIAATTTNPQ